MQEQLLSIFVTYFVVIDPIGIAPLFASLTRGGAPAYRKRMAIKGVAIATGILLFFALTGDLLLRLLGISIPAFRIAGGALLFILALDMVLARPSGMRNATVREQEEAHFKDDISVFPLAFPLLSGPGALTTVLLTTSRAQASPMLFYGALGALLVVLGLTLLALLAAPRLLKLMGDTGAMVVDRLFGVILAALAAQYVVDGVRASLLTAA